MDENRELRAMLFSVIHIPPLPSIVSRLDREDNSVVDDAAVESSHSIIGSMLEWTAMANNQTANTNRMNMQNALLTQFRSDLEKIDPVSCPVEDLYNFYCYHTRAWLNTYSTLGNMMRFKPLEYVLNNDKTHQNMRGYTKAQFHLFTDGKETLELEDSVTYPDLLRKCAQWTKEAYAGEVNDKPECDLDAENSAKSQPQASDDSCVDVESTKEHGMSELNHTRDEIYTPTIDRDFDCHGLIQSKEETDSDTHKNTDSISDKDENLKISSDINNSNFIETEIPINSVIESVR
jgi:hypothetical protein